MAFDNSFIDNLKAGINIVDVIGRDVRLTKAGSNYKGLCPFHNEKTPSFMVSESKQIFNCFGCGEKGDVIEYVKRRGNFTFMEAVEKLCEDYNIEMPAFSGPKIDYNKYYEINRKAARFFYDNLTGGRNKGYSYIRGRGLTNETIVKFGLGYAPDSWTALLDHMKGEGVSEDDLLKVGLVVRNKDRCYDKFRNRVMFPIFNTQGKVIGFGGRALGDAKPKYLNSPESEIFLKKNNLYALNFTKGDVAEADSVLVVEGYMDAISLYQHGVKNVSSSLGTALTENQGRLISRFTKNVVLSYDSDAAGISAAVRGIDVVRAAGCNVRILRVTDGKDPDEFVRKNGREAFEKLIHDAVPAPEFKLSILERGFDLSDDTQIIEYIRQCVPTLRSLGAVEQNIYVKKLANRFGLSEHSIELEIRSDGESRMQPVPNTVRAHDRGRRRRNDEGLRLEMSLIVLAMYDSGYLERYRADNIDFRTQAGRRYYGVLREAAQSGVNRGGEIDSRKVFERLDPDEEALLKRALDIIKIGPDDEVFYHECRSRYALEGYKVRRMELVNEVQTAEKAGNGEDMARLVEELTRLDEEIRKVRRD